MRSLHTHQEGIEKLRSAKLSMKMSKSNFFSKEIQYLGHILSTTGIQPLPSKHMPYNICNQPLHPNKFEHFLDWLAITEKFLKGFAKIAKPLTLLMDQQIKFHWTPLHNTTFLSLKEAIIQAPILCYPDPNKKYIVYTDVSDDTCGAYLSQEHDGTEFQVVFLSHTFTETQRKWSTNELEVYGVYYAITKWNYYLQDMDITVKNDHKPLPSFYKMYKMPTTRLLDAV